MPDQTWSNELALVTGAAGSIGSAIVGELARHGARVAASDSTSADVELTGATRYDRVDVTSSSAVDCWVGAVTAAWGPPTIGVVCAGISRAGSLLETSDTDWQAVIDVNLTGAFYAARAMARQMLSAGRGGRIVLVGSWAAHAPHPHIGAYSASKAGLRALGQTLALDLARHGILVNEVAPGIVNGGLSRELFRQDRALEQRTKGAIPVGLILQPEDVARDVAFLASPENRLTTGCVIVSDGGIGLASLMNPGR